jgi:molybdopterin-containing oxidoreductase family iron-sulfur binding subunit
VKAVPLIDNNTIAGLNLLQMLVHASILSLYDNMRLKSPKIAGKDSWSAVDAKIKSILMQG